MREQISSLDTAAMKFATPLPIDAVLDELRAALAARASAVLVAPPGAGKTTRVPLALMDEGWLAGRKILVLEPRRIAARAAAERMAHSLSEAVGERIGLRARMVSKSGPKTRIEVVTEGVFTRMILDDPELSGIGAVLFDEFHERSLDADLGLALALDCQRGLRDDLRILPMSATLDGARVAQLLGDAPVIASEGRAFPVETRYLGRDANARIEDQMADAVMRALRAEPGSILAFLPGQGEIRRVEERLKERISDPAIVLAPLYGAMDMRGAGPCARASAQGPAQGGARDLDRRDVDHHRGRARRHRQRPCAGSALRAGRRRDPARDRARVSRRRRSAPGPRRPHRARRLLSPVGRAANAEPCPLSPSPRFAPPILPACCSTARNGEQPIRARCPGSIRRSAAAIDAAREELTELEALDADGRITAIGQAAEVAAVAAPACPHGDLPRPSSATREEAAEIAAVIVERGLGGNDADLAHRLEGFRRDRSRRAERHAKAGGRLGADGERGSCRRRRLREDDVDRAAAGARLSGAHRQGTRRTRPVPPRQWPRRQPRCDASLGAIALPGRGGAVGIGGVDAHPARGRSR